MFTDNYLGDGYVGKPSVARVVGCTAIVNSLPQGSDF